MGRAHVHFDIACAYAHVQSMCMCIHMASTWNTMGPERGFRIQRGPRLAVRIPVRISR